MSVSKKLRDAVEVATQAGTTRYAIAKASGIDQASFIRWLDEGADIRLSTVDRLAAYFGLVLVAGDPVPLAPAAPKPKETKKAESQKKPAAPPSKAHKANPPPSKKTFRKPNTNLKDE